MTNPSRRIDAHVHLWQVARGDYDWMTPKVAPLLRDFGADELRPLVDAAGVTEVVVVQAAATVAETEYLLGLAHDVDFIAGIVGWVDLESPGAAKVLRRLGADPFFKGIRPMIQDIADPGWMLRDELEPGLQWIIDNDLAFDCLVKPVHLPYLERFLARYPDLKAVIDHGAKPNIAAREFDEWADRMRALAEETAVLCKFSGLVTEAGAQWGTTDLRPYTQHLMTCFGADRLLFASDWPVVTLAASYNEWFWAAQTLLDRMDHAKIFGDNAARFYAL